MRTLNNTEWGGGGAGMQRERGAGSAHAVHAPSLFHADDAGTPKVPLFTCRKGAPFYFR